MTPYEDTHPAIKRLDAAIRLTKEQVAYDELQDAGLFVEVKALLHDVDALGQRIAAKQDGWQTKDRDAVAVAYARLTGDARALVEQVVSLHPVHTERQ